MHAKPPATLFPCTRCSPPRRALIVLLLIGIGPALLRQYLKPLISGTGMASARVVLRRDDSLGQLCLLQQVDAADDATPPPDAGEALPAELALGSSLLQWTVKVRCATQIHCPVCASCSLCCAQIIRTATLQNTHPVVPHAKLTVQVLSFVVTSF